MIPIKLSLRNFMCYRDNVPPLSFEGIHTACIAGDNGNGKSTLIDAMTWALWGKARAKRDDDLIHLGEGVTEMEVEFDFAVSAQTYRIIRKHAKPKRRGGQGKSILEFQLASDGGYRTLTGNSIAQTQQKIIDVLHMDYITFVNSALLLQGRADEFTLKRPVERKQVLADILGLSFYDTLEERAKELARKQEIEKTQLESQVAELAREISQKPDYEVEFNAGQMRLAAVEEEVTRQETSLSGLRREKETLENKKGELTQLEERLTKTARDLERWDELTRQHLARLKEYEALITERPAIEEGYARFTQARNLNSELDQKLRLINNLNERKHRLELTITQAGQALIKEHAVAQSQIGELEADGQRLPSLRQELQQAQLRLKELSEPEARLSREKQDTRKLSTEINYLESSLTRLKQELKELEEKLDLLLNHQAGTRCPLCETELAEEGIKIIEAKYTTDRQDKLESLRINEAELKQKKTEHSQRESEASQLENRLNQEKAALQTREGVLLQEISKAEEAKSRLSDVRKNLAEVEEHLARRDFAASEQQTLNNLEDELTRLSYNPKEHDEARQLLSRLEKYEDLKRKLDEAERLIKQERESAARAGEAAQELRHSLELENRQRQSLGAEISRLPEVLNNYARAEHEYRELAPRQKEAQEALGAMKARLERLSELEIRRKDKEKLLAWAAKEEKLYKDLAQAFGKRGIQALLIESALPEIEAEATELLARMTDNRMHIKIETQRETKAGHSLETLDIKIADELGTRNYEMYSGGEAFRINFAIRIALSKLLARRAGAPLPTLVIDEGFGTQDTTGIEKLKEAINSIQDSFEKILVITHIEELRDAFPTRINVIKTAEGSTLEVN